MQFVQTTQTSNGSSGGLGVRIILLLMLKKKLLNIIRHFYFCLRWALRGHWKTTCHIILLPGLTILKNKLFLIFKANVLHPLFPVVIQNFSFSISIGWMLSYIFLLLLHLVTILYGSVSFLGRSGAGGRRGRVHLLLTYAENVVLLVCAREELLSASEHCWRKPPR